MSSGGKVRVVVRSHLVPVGTKVVTIPVFTSSGVRVSSRTERIVQYESRLDKTYERAIKEGKRLSCNLGLELEVIDSSLQGPVHRIRSSFGLANSKGPMIVVSPSAEAYLSR